MKYTKRVITPPPLSIDYLYQRFRKKLLNTAYSVFAWEGLPDSIDEQFLTGELIEHGAVGIVNTPNGLYAVRGDVGGEMNAYYKPTRWIYANPVLGSGNPEIGRECAVIYLTSEDMNPFTMSGGLSQLIDSTALLLADNIISLNVAQKNTRIMLLAAADNEATANSAENTIKAMYAGQPYKVLTKRLADSFEVNPLANIKTAENMRQLVETQQYILAHFLQELGINANFNLKRERLSQSEVELNTDCLDTLIDDMEKTINGGIDVCNALYGTNIKFRMKRYGEENTQDTENEQETDTESEQETGATENEQ